MNNLIEVNTEEISSGSIREEGLGSSLFKRLSVFSPSKYPLFKLMIITDVIRQIAVITS
jgi:hypothetical protein